MHDFTLVRCVRMTVKIGLQGRLGVAHQGIGPFSVSLTQLLQMVCDGLYVVSGSVGIVAEIVFQYGRVAAVHGKLIGVGLFVDLGVFVGIEQYTAKEYGDTERHNEHGLVFLRLRLALGCRARFVLWAQRRCRRGRGVNGR